MNADQVYSLIKYIVGKNISQGYVSPDDFYVAINTAQDEYTDYLLGEYQKYQVGRPIAAVEVGQKEKVRQSLAPLVYGKVLVPNPVTGVAAYPNDYELADAMWGVYNIYNIRFTNQPRLASFFNSSIDIIADNPVYLLQSDGFQFYPTNIGLAKLSYFRKPPSIVWGYTLDSNGVPVWNPATSQNPVWGNFDMSNIIARALRIIGVNLNDQQVNQYAEEIKVGGQ